MLSLKEGVKFEAISDRIVEILPSLTRIYRIFGQTCVITSARDGRHRTGSKHYTGEALDLRTFYFNQMEQRDIHREIQQALGSDFDVILEDDHIHVEFDPK